MKEYLKMADVFDCEVESDADLMFSDSLGNIADFSGYKTQCRYTTHAINSHDELVEMNKDLLEALDGLMSITCDSRGVVGYHLNGDIAEWDEFEEVAVAHDTIAKAKAKGGAI